MRFMTAVAAFLVVIGGLTPISSARALADDPPALDCAAASERAAPLRSRAQLTAARAELTVCSAPSCPVEVRDACIRRVGEVDAAMPTIVFGATDAAGGDLLDVTVKIDDEPTPRRLDGTALSLDPGPHTFSFASPGRSVIQRRLLLLEGEKYRRERVAFEPAEAAKRATALDSAEPRSPEPLRGERQPGLGGMRTLGLALGAAGVVGLGVGIGYGLAAISRHAAAAEACPARCSDQSGVELWDRARAAGNASTIAFLVGGAALTGGLVLWLGSRPESETPPRAQLGLGPGVVEMLGRW